MTEEERKETMIDLEILKEESRALRREANRLLAYYYIMAVVSLIIFVAGLFILIAEKVR